MSVHNPFSDLSVILLPDGSDPKHLYAAVTVNYDRQCVTYAAFHAEYSMVPDGANIEDLYAQAVVRNLFDASEDNSEFETEFTSPDPQDWMQSGAQGFGGARYAARGLRFRFAPDGLIYRYMNKTTFWLNSPRRGADELVDWCAINFVVKADGALVGWRAQHLASRDTKACFMRLLASENTFSLFNIFIPTLIGGLENACFFTVEARPGAQVRCNLAVIRTLQGSDEAGEQPLTYPSRALRITPLVAPRVEAGGTLDLPVSIVWKKTGLPIGLPLTLHVASKQGYIPNHNLAVDENGRATVRVMALGMQPGEKIRLKIGTEAMTVLDRFPIEIEVV